MHGCTALISQRAHAPRELLSSPFYTAEAVSLHACRNSALVLCRSVFLHDSSYAVVVFEQEAEAGGARFTQLHLAASPILALINTPNYAALLGFTQGNLTEVSSFQNAKNTKDTPNPKRYKFNADFKFGPPAGDVPTFRMTADLPEVAVSHPCSHAARALSPRILAHLITAQPSIPPLPALAPNSLPIPLLFMLAWIC